MGTRTSAARAEVLAAREGLDEELVRLEAAGRAAVDIPARLRREPAKVLGTAGGAAFLLLGGPKRAFKGVRRAIFGAEAELPKSMLPPEVQKTLKKLGPDGEAPRRARARRMPSANVKPSGSSARSASWRPSRSVTGFRTPPRSVAAVVVRSRSRRIPLAASTR